MRQCTMRRICLPKIPKRRTRGVNIWEYNIVLHPPVLFLALCICAKNVVFRSSPRISEGRSAAKSWPPKRPTNPIRNAQFHPPYSRSRKPGKLSSLYQGGLHNRSWTTQHIWIASIIFELAEPENLISHIIVSKNYCIVNAFICSANPFI